MLYGTAIWAYRHKAMQEPEPVRRFFYVDESGDRARLAAIDVPQVTTVGDRSGPERHRVAALLAGLGAAAVTLPGCGHLAPVDAPTALAAAIVGSAAGGPTRSPHSSGDPTR